MSFSKLQKAVIFLGFLVVNVAYGQQRAPDIHFDSSEGYYVVEYWDEVDSTTHKATVMPGNRVEPYLKAFVRKEGSRFIYKYHLENGGNSKQGIYALLVEILAEVSESVKPSPQWNTGIMESKPAFDWAHVHGNPPGVPPGSEETRFGFKSSGLPAVVKSFAGGYSWTSFPGEGPVGRAAVVMDSIANENKYVTLKTIGPKDPPHPFNNTAFTDTLSTYLDRSCTELGWIENQGICRSLEAKLDNVERQLDRGNTNAASGSLEAFINEVEAQKDKQLSSEAYALLYFNGQYLLEQLNQ